MSEMSQSELQDLLTVYVLEERDRQDALHGEMPRHMTPAAWLVILNAELGEVSRAILKHEPNNYIVELIQVAATCLAAIEDYVVGESIIPLCDILKKNIKYQDNIKTVYKDNANPFYQELNER